MIQAFYPVRGYNYSHIIEKIPIVDFKKFGAANDLVDDLTFHYVEKGIKSTTDYSDIDSAFYLSI